MKKIILLLIIPLLITGCSENKGDMGSNVVDTNTTTSTSTTTTTESTTTSTTKKTTTTTTKKKTTYKVVSDTKKTTTSCEKVFNKKVDKVYESEKKCQSAGNNLFMEADTSKVTNFDCVSIKDKCGTTWYYLEWYKFDQKTDYVKMK